MTDKRRMQETAEQDAIAFLLRVNAPEATEGDWTALCAWLEAAAEHRAAYDRVERMDAEVADAASALSRALEGRTASSVPRRARTTGRQGSRPSWRAVAGLAAAAAAALTVFVAVRPPAPAPTETFQAAQAQDRLVSLADGSTVHLNRGARISVRFEPKGRFVELAEGQAVFAVAKDPTRPFHVAAGDRNIQVVGTEFDVLRHEGRLRVTVREGLVAVRSPQAPAAAQPIMLRAGDQFERPAGQTVATVRQVDPEAVFAWRRGDLVYRDQPLADVVSDLNLYFATPVRVEAAAGRMRFSGVLRIDGEDAMVRRLEAFLPVEASRDAGGLTLRARAQG